MLSVSTAAGTLLRRTVAPELSQGRDARHRWAGATLADVLRLRHTNSARCRCASKLGSVTCSPQQIGHHDLPRGRAQPPRYLRHEAEPPSEFRGEFRPIRSNVPGMEMCELLPQQAKIATSFPSSAARPGSSPTTSASKIFTGFPKSIRGPSFGSVVSPSARAGVNAEVRQPAGRRRRDRRGRGPAVGGGAAPPVRAEGPGGSRTLR